jgi:hypothetical protein
MYVGLIFSIPGVTFDLDSFGFEVLICGSSAKHNAAPKKQSAKINPVVFIFMRPIESGSLFPVNISLFADEQPGLLTRFGATRSASLCAQMKSRISEQVYDANGAKRSVKAAQPVKNREIIAKNLRKAGWAWWYVSAVDCNGRPNRLNYQ